MARIPYADLTRPDVAPLAERIKAERGGKVLNLYKMLLQSPPLAEGWLNFLTAVRQKGSLSGHYREAAIIRVAVLNGADYERKAHIPFALKEGWTQAQVDALGAGREPEGATDAERALLAYADAMTKAIHVPDGVFTAVRKHFGERELVELTITIAAYNCVSRFLEALGIDPE
jgi:alkylhydroperoxidase family enzyme